MTRTPADFAREAWAAVEARADSARYSGPSLESLFAAAMDQARAEREDEWRAWSARFNAGVARIVTVARWAARWKRAAKLARALTQEAHRGRSVRPEKAAPRGGRTMTQNPVWLTIDSAPRDGTAVLVMCDIWPGTKSGRAEECNGHNTYVAEWWAHEDDERSGKWVCYMDWILDPGCPIVPTHWMPLPPPPARWAEEDGEIVALEPRE